MLPLPLDKEAFGRINNTRFINPSTVLITSAPTQTPPSPPTRADALTDFVQGRTKAKVAFLPRVDRSRHRANIRFVSAPPPFRAAPSPPPPPSPPPTPPPPLDMSLRAMLTGKSAGGSRRSGGRSSTHAKASVFLTQTHVTFQRDPKLTELLVPPPPSPPPSPARRRRRGDDAADEGEARRRDRGKRASRGLSAVEI